MVALKSIYYLLILLMLLKMMKAIYPRMLFQLFKDELESKNEVIKFSSLF